jgi:hypothetical protein
MIKMRLLRRLPEQLQRQRELVELYGLYRRLSGEESRKERPQSLLKKIQKKGLKFSVERLIELPVLQAGLTYTVSNLWTEATASYVYGMFNATIFAAALACELQLREQLGFPKGRRAYGQLLMGVEWKGHDGQKRKRWEEIIYEDFTEEFGDQISLELWTLHKQMVENYRNPYVHFDLDTHKPRWKVSLGLSVIFRFLKMFC